MAYTASDALIHLGGPEVERHVRPLLTHPDKNLVRRQAMVILQRLQGKNFLPTLRLMMVDPNFGLQDMAAGALAEVGTPEDLRLLLPLSDFWKADRPNLYWVHSAIASIRDRFNYDIHGPIRAGVSG
ncbi:MAG: HEAT repeat domain-containing protein, partial [Armatimonadota bacterium]|nr:HEAT repeat domain-containing protein [Armatimonadota bacterium]